MDTTFQISEVFQTSWKHVKSQIWVLAGLVIYHQLVYPTVARLDRGDDYRLSNQFVYFSYLFGRIYKESVPDDGGR